MINNRPFISVEGNIGAGKTSLAKFLAAQLGYNLLLEKFEDDPYLKLFYQEPERFAFHTELSMFLSRLDSVRKEIEQEGKGTVSDFYLGKSLVFASITLHQSEQRLFEQVYKHAAFNLPEPDVLIYIHTKLDRLKQNIKIRGREYEQEIKDEYLEQISVKYEALIENCSAAKIIRLEGDPAFYENNGIKYAKAVGILKEHLGIS